jgi:hypothetical protein
MHLFSIKEPLEGGGGGFSIDIRGPLPDSKMGNQYPLITVAYFTKWSEGYVVPLQGASSITEVLVTTFFCQIGILRELHTNKTGTLNCDIECIKEIETRDYLSLCASSQSKVPNNKMEA